jgi:hypothetical protein
MSLASINRKIEALTADMQTAAAAEDFETAARLRNEIATLKGEIDGGGSPLVRQPPPGEMGLGTHIPVAQRPKGWRPPPKPDPMTRSVKPRKR